MVRSRTVDSSEAVELLESITGQVINQHKSWLPQIKNLLECTLARVFNCV